MSGFSTTQTQHVIRSNLWSSDLKEFFEDELLAMKYVKMLDGFNDGTTINIPSLGQAEVRDYEEGRAVQYSAADTGNFTFTIDEYKQTGYHITNQMMQDSYVTEQIVSEMPRKMNRALQKAMEVSILARGPQGQTAGNINLINDAQHRWVAGGTNETIALQDFARAKYALRKAQVPMTNLVAIVDPSIEYSLSTLANLVQVSNNPQWEGIVRDGMSTGMRFLMNVYGFDVYTSDNLLQVGTETIGARTTAQGVANLFFSTAPDALPFVGSIRQTPKIDSEYNKDFQREEFVVTARYGFKLFRPENMVVVLSDTDQVYV
jgi:hypothetical protein